MINAIKEYLHWGNMRAFIVKILFMTIAVCMSVMAYDWAEQFKGFISIVVFCAFIAFDLVLVPRFPNIVHYTNSIIATVFSIAFMCLIGFASMGSMVASKEDAGYTTLLEMIETKKMRIERLESMKASFIMGDDTDGLMKWQRANKSDLNELNDEYEDLLKQKKNYNEKKGGSFKDASIAPLKWMADELDTTPEALSVYILPMLWLAILSIQSVLSAEAHNIKIYRPSLMRGLGVLIAYTLDFKQRYINNYDAEINGKGTEAKKNKTDLKAA